MPCSISDGLQYDDWLEQDDLTEDEDAAYDRWRQENVDNEQEERENSPHE